MAGCEHYEGERSGATNRGRRLLDVSWRRPEIRDVSIGENEVERLTVRLASAFVGAVRPGRRPDRRCVATRLVFSTADGQKKDPYAVFLRRTCSTCRSPYRSVFEDVGPDCHAPTLRLDGAWTARSLSLTAGKKNDLSAL